MRKMELNKIAVMGAGSMGTAIAQVVATGGYPVYIRDISMDILGRSKNKIDHQLKKLVKKGKISPEDTNNILNRITFTEDLRVAVENADFIIEAVPENLDLKKKVFSEMDRVAKSSAIFSSNTSQLSIASIGEATSRKEQVIGTHWFFPPQVMKLIEVVVSPATSQETLEVALAFCKKIGKETVICKDAQGFITSRAISALVSECLRIYEDGIASIEDIDRAMKLGFNHPVGPFQLMDMSGIDVVYQSLEALSKVYGDRFKPTGTISKLVQEGNLGQKTSKGFYTYNSR
ncbi:MAG: 3-hydroxyacyl-CoA dehydrogenase family protein [Desulfobacteraceae bacterium]